MTKTQTVLWRQAWYDLDQSLTVGDIGYFDIIKVDKSWKFGSLLNKGGEKIKLSILKISNSDLGTITRIDATGLSYKFWTNDFHYFQVEAEENPGMIEQGLNEPRHLKDLDFLVEVEAMESFKL